MGFLLKPTSKGSCPLGFFFFFGDLWRPLYQQYLFGTNLGPVPFRSLDFYDDAATQHFDGFGVGFFHSSKSYRMQFYCDQLFNLDFSTGIEFLLYDRFMLPFWCTAQFPSKHYYSSALCCDHFYSILGFSALGIVVCDTYGSCVRHFGSFQYALALLWNVSQSMLKVLSLSALSQN